jgi:hypothetical protein
MADLPNGMSADAVKEYIERLSSDPGKNIHHQHR